MSTTVEQVVLLADDGSAAGVADKSTVHTEATPLHLAFSCHVFDQAGRILVTRRALTKVAWPGVWTNSFCGHPAPEEDINRAVHRRASYELGVRLDSVELVLPDFRYRAVDASGIVENEVCPVYRATVSDVVDPRPDEVAEWMWVDPERLATAVEATPWAFSPWLTLQLPLLAEAGSWARGVDVTPTATRS
ncbi:isopentenyl-diphosphate Delta-isomerase [Mycetocola zhujimingii]|uniref:isopentenyl-diphosphate Delta-isomerase n=1 Tax=Mycetocola zhujimingii TaxID=2079792 RepID=UPI000D37D3FF|nr:isopentenyl-diphosphate Delta-isomerase [Mycetocola zhujimingii]AWB86419.1 isopentenyl-diphosphate delta-isomerase [Mycetocola zhujimingii]